MRYPPLCNTISKRYCAIWGVISHSAAKYMHFFVRCLSAPQWPFPRLPQTLLFKALEASRAFPEFSPPQYGWGTPLLQKCQKNVRNPSHHYFSKKYCNTIQCVLSAFAATELFQEREILQYSSRCIAVRLPFVSQYASRLYHSTPPICIAICLPLASKRTLPPLKRSCLGQLSDCCSQP